MTVLVKKTDSQIKADVLAELKWDPIVTETEVGVQVDRGVVTLSGIVSSYAKRLAARAAAHRVAGVFDVADDLVVKLSHTWERTDADVAKAVRNALNWNTLVPAQSITTTVSYGVVTLGGAVDTWSQRFDAGRAIEHLIGVRGVLNHMVISPKAISSVQVKRLIEDALDRQAQREANRIQVLVEDGKVSISGVVRSWGERNAIYRAASLAPGVCSVVERMTVDPYM